MNLGFDDQPSVGENIIILLGLMVRLACAVNCCVLARGLLTHSALRVACCGSCVM